MKLNRQLKIKGDLKDRGNIKWQGLMLPEHIQMLRELNEEKKREPKPELDGFDLQLIQEEIEVAMKRQCEVMIKTWNDGEVLKHIGVIDRIDMQSRSIVYEETFGSKKIPIGEVVGIELLE